MAKLNKGRQQKKKNAKTKMACTSYETPARVTRPLGGIAERMPKATQSIYSMPEGSVVVRDNELWYQVEGNSPANIQTRVFQPGVSLLQRLDQIASTYELYRVKSLLIHYYSNCGYNTNGMIHCGVDFDATDSTTSVNGVAMLRPGFRGPVYLPRETIRVDVGRINRQKWMFTKAGPSDNGNQSKGFLLATAATAVPALVPSPVGEIYCEYEVEFSGPVTPGEVTESVAASCASVVDFLASSGVVDAVIVQRLQSKVGDVTSPTSPPYILNTTIDNPTGFSTTNWMTTNVNLTAVPNTMYNLTVEYSSSVNAPTIQPIYNNVTNGTVYKTRLVNTGGSYGTVSSFMAQVLTDALGKFVGALTVTCDHFPSAAASVFCKALVASFGSSPIIAQYYEHLE